MSFNLTLSLRVSTYLEKTRVGQNPKTNLRLGDRKYVIINNIYYLCGV